MMQGQGMDRLMDSVEQRIFIGEGSNHLAVLCAIEFDEYIIDKDTIEIELDRMIERIAQKIATHFNQLERTKQ